MLIVSSVPSLGHCHCNLSSFLFNGCRLLESKNSPLLGLLMESMRVMLKDYKNEMEEILVADKQLHKELLYDIQKHEASKARTKVAAAVASCGPTPATAPSAHRTPGSMGPARFGSASACTVATREEVPTALLPKTSSHTDQGACLEKVFEKCVVRFPHCMMNLT